MIKVVLKCEKCEKETLSSDLEGIFTVNFLKKTIEFQCPHCNHVNMFDFNKIANYSKLPKITKSRY